MLRIPVRDELKPVVERAVELARAPGAQTRGSGAGYVAATDGDETTESDSDGNTLYNFMLNVDALNQPYALLHVDGKTYDYANSI